MVELGLAPSRTRARALIEAGAVRVDGRPVIQPAARAGGEIAVTADFPWVGRGALKLLHALDHFGLTPHGEALDIGASTGGFTQVLLARGAARVHALDVGHGQLDPGLAADPRVVSLEGVNARTLPAGAGAGLAAGLPPPDWITADVSFISLRLALPAALALARPGAHLVALIKPQFEAGPGHVRKGIVRDPAIHARVCADIAALLSARGWRVLGLTESPITGGDGNREFLIAARLPG